MQKYGFLPDLRHSGSGKNKVAAFKICFYTQLALLLQKKQKETLCA